MLPLIPTSLLLSTQPSPSTFRYLRDRFSDMKIEWASHFNPDGTRRQPPPSTMHGWLAKMRGTIIGDEDLRSRGMKEMRDAQKARNYKAQSKRRHQHSAHTGKSLFSFLGFGKAKKQQTSRSIQPRPKVLQQDSSSKRPAPTPRHSSRNTRPPARPSGNSHRSSHRHQRPTGSSRPSYSSQTGQRKSGRR